MKTIVEILSPLKEGITFSNAVLYKTAQLKQDIIFYLIKKERATIAELSQHTKTSIPKINETVNELIHEGIILDHGKILNGVGRKPNIYGLNPDCAYFLSVEATRQHINIAIVNFLEEPIHTQRDIPFTLENTDECFERLCSIIEEFLSIPDFDRTKTIGMGLNLIGRINQKSGNSYTYFNFENQPLSEVLESRFQIPVFIENDTRAMAYGEYAKGVIEEEKNVLFINLDEGIGMGIIIDGILYSGKSGFAGEFGHMPILHNDILCHCGKKGCLETEASGLTLIQQTKHAIRQGTTTILTDHIHHVEDIKLVHIIDAALHDDMLAIDLISKAGERIGKGLAILLNIFNPELVVLGGRVALSGPIVLLPILSAINKFSPNLVNGDTQFKMSSLGEEAGLIGGALLVRNKLLSIEQ
ncbi:ROK family transcriptional regulator [Sphingobacterium sp. SYP-B4668]|uniref:ROK family transcriptional regulator n=1 Tax=Sphingobacterium sp. SYP-B4668 TaxID=2996035 RepID=UPI0022DDC69B|nr:ROK family transcriptional regulator [Sphingobacterium sp. SYP-B4668]